MSPGGFGASPFGLLAAIWAPIRTLRRVAEERRALPGLVVVALYAAFGLVSSAVFALTGVTRRQIEQQSQQGLAPGVEDAIARAAEIGAPISAALTPFVVWISVSLLMQLTTRFFGGTGPLSSMLGVVGVAQAPFFISGVLAAVLTGAQLLVGVGSPVGVVIGYLVSLLGFAFFIWYAVLVVIGAGLARGIGYGESAGSCALSCVGLGILIILVVIVAAIGIFAAVNAATPR